MSQVTISKETMEKLSNKEWRIAHLYKIKDKNQQVITFKRNAAQEHFNKHKHNRNIILKSRQLGFTTDECIDNLDDALWTRNFNSLMLSYDKDSALEIFDEKIVFAWENIPDELKKLWKADTERANKLKFDFGDKTNSSVLVRTKGRSGTFNRLHVSEFGKICRESPRKAAEIISGTFQTVPLGGRIDIESTAEGEFGAFYDMFWEAWQRGEPKNNSQFKAFFYNWQWDYEALAKVTALPFEAMENADTFREYQARNKLSQVEITYYYYKWLECGRDWNVLHQEYPTTPEEAFVSSGNKLFDQDKVRLQVERYAADGAIQGEWRIYDTYRHGHIYAMGVDVSEGVGQDASAAVVWDFTLRPKVVAVYINDTISPNDLAYEAREMGLRYGTCLIAVERNNHGHACLQKLKEIYPTDAIYKEVRVDKETDKETEKLGWLTSMASKPKMMYDLKSVVNDEFVEIPDRIILLQMRTYDREDIGVIRYADEQDVKHWDALIACAIGFQMRVYAESTTGDIRTTVPSQQNDIMDLESLI